MLFRRLILLSAAAVLSGCATTTALYRDGKPTGTMIEWYAVRTPVALEGVISAAEPRKLLSRVRREAGARKEPTSVPPENGVPTSTVGWAEDGSQSGTKYTTYGRDDQLMVRQTTENDTARMQYGLARHPDCVRVRMSKQKDGTRLKIGRQKVFVPRNSGYVLTRQSAGETYVFVFTPRLTSDEFFKTNSGLGLGPAKPKP